MATEQEQALTKLRKLIPQGATIHTIQRARLVGGIEFDLYYIEFLPKTGKSHTNWLTGKVATALDLERTKDDHILMSGTGTELRADTVQDLAQALYGNTSALDHFPF